MIHIHMWHIWDDTHTHVTLVRWHTDTCEITYRPLVESGVDGFSAAADFFFSSFPLTEAAVVWAVRSADTVRGLVWLITSSENPVDNVAVRGAFTLPLDSLEEAAPVKGSVVGCGGSSRSIESWHGTSDAEAAKEKRITSMLRRVAGNSGNFFRVISRNAKIQTYLKLLPGWVITMKFSVGYKTFMRPVQTSLK